MSYTNGLDKPSDYFNTITYVANQTDDRQITVGFQPDFTWLKDRDQAVNYDLYDAVRGATKSLSTNNTNAEATQTDGLKSFNSTGFTLGTGWGNQTTGDDYVAWNWLASNSTASNTDGTITSNVSANQTSGFSIVSYTGTGSDANVGHSLSSAPELIITKSRSATGDWKVHTSAIDGSWDVGTLNSTAAFGNSSYTAPTSSIFYVGTGAPTNASGVTYVSYLFHSVKSFSKCGVYSGNGSSSGTYIHLGFKPAVFLSKRTDAIKDWHIIDNKRDIDNPTQTILYPNANFTEGTPTAVDFVSGGIKIRNSNVFINGSGATYLYYAVAENPFTTSTGIPCTAR